MLVGAFGYAQGTVNFNTRVIPDVDVKVFDVDGTTPLAGTGFTAQLFGGIQGTAESSLAALVPTTAFRTGAGAGYVVPPASPVPVPGVPENGTATLELRVWDNMGGTITSYAQAVTAGGKYGTSNLFDVGPLGGVLTTPANLKGLTFWPMIPEPSTIALGILGAAALLLRRRK